MIPPPLIRKDVFWPFIKVGLLADVTLSRFANDPLTSWISIALLPGFLFLRMTPLLMKSYEAVTPAEEEVMASNTSCAVIEGVMEIDCPLIFIAPGFGWDAQEVQFEKFEVEELRGTSSRSLPNPPLSVLTVLVPLLKRRASCRKFVGELASDPRLIVPGPFITNLSFVMLAEYPGIRFI